MTLLERTTTYRRETATRANRNHSERVEKRVDEIAVVAEVHTDYTKADRAGDLAIEAKFQELYQLVDTEAEKEAVAKAFATWQRTEQREDLAVSTSVGGAVSLLRDNNDYWLGAFVPDGDGGAA